jgi:hypothetical protein
MSGSAAKDVEVVLTNFKALSKHMPEKAAGNLE